MAQSTVHGSFPPGIAIVLAVDSVEYLFIFSFESILIETATIEKTLEDIRFRIFVRPTRFINAISVTLGGWIADSYFGKYTVYLISWVLLTSICIPQLIVTMSTTWQSYRTKVDYLRMYYYLKSWLQFGSALKIPIIAEQFRIPEMIYTYQLYLFCDLWLQNIAILIAFALTPVFSHFIECYSTNICTRIPFILGLFMNWVYLIVFLKLYNILYMYKRKIQIVEKMFYCIFKALTKKDMDGGRRITDQKSWVYYASGYCNDQVIEMTRYFINVLLVMITCAPYWAFYHSIAFTSLLQENLLDIDSTYFFEYPVSTKAIPAILNLILIPIVYKCIFSTGAIIRYFDHPLKAFGISYCFVGCGLLCATFLNIFIQQNDTASPVWGSGQLKIYNGLPFPISINCERFNEEVTINPYGLKKLSILITNDSSANIELFNKKENYFWTGNIVLYDHESVSYIAKKNGLILTDGFDNISRLHASRPKVILYCADQCNSSVVTYQHIPSTMNFTGKIPNGTEKRVITMFGLGEYFMYINGRMYEKYHFKSGGIYSLLFYQNGQGQLAWSKFTLATNRIPVFFMIPQYIFISFAQVFGHVPFHILLYLITPPNLRGFCYSINMMLTKLFNGVLLIVEYYAGLSASTVTFNSSLLLFGAFLFYILMAMKLNIEIQYD